MIWFIAVAFAGLYRYWGEQEYGSGTVMLLLSIGASAFAIVMGWRMFGVFLAQIALGAVFFAYHLTRPMKKNF